MADVRSPTRDVGQGVIEYALLLTLIVVVAVSLMNTVGGDVRAVFVQASEALSPGAGDGNGWGQGGNGNGNNGNGNGNGGPSGSTPGNGNPGGGGGRGGN